MDQDQTEHIRVDFTCSLPGCQPANANLLDPEQLQNQGVLSFVQLHPCGHTFCTRCFKLMLLSSAQFQHSQEMKCPVNNCKKIAIDQLPVETSNVAMAPSRNCFLEPPVGNARPVCVLRLSILADRERITPGRFVIQGGEQATAENIQDFAEVFPVWVFVTETNRFEQLLKIVSEWQNDKRLFSRMSSGGSTIDSQLLILLGINPNPSGFQVRANRSFQAQAGLVNRADPENLSPLVSEQKSSDLVNPEVKPIDVEAPNSISLDSPQAPPPASVAVDANANPGVHMPDGQPQYVQQSLQSNPSNLDSRPSRSVQPSTSDLANNIAGMNFNERRPEPPQPSPPPPPPAPVYGIDVDSLLGEFLLMEP